MVPDSDFEFDFRLFFFADAFLTTLLLSIRCSFPNLLLLICFLLDTHPPKLLTILYAIGIGIGISSSSVCVCYVHKYGKVNNLERNDNICCT
ncbi:hypothetical protein BT96DRAFT_49805 [Gymnopus androsaceus JB14]|uniref:Uncharacterized protein n=1 Tax=Gymnopus androsaceus JB14 TaxID=1447944 RepID=A0A6A4HLA5_9AGAR|nr:hypothetical protein BT96DRAFT_49805 [Gymnopus androsaceus JB14]